MPEQPIRLEELLKTLQGGSKAGGDFITHTDRKIEKLEEAVAQRDARLADLGKIVEDPVVQRYWKHRQTCPGGNGCLFEADPSDVFKDGVEQGLQQGTEKGRGEALADYKSIPAEVIGKWMKWKSQEWKK